MRAFIFQETNIVRCSIVPCMVESKLANGNYCSKPYSEYSLASIVSNYTTTSKFNPIRADFDKTASQEKQGQTTETLQGTINFGKNIFNPDNRKRIAVKLGHPTSSAIHLLILVTMVQ